MNAGLAPPARALLWLGLGLLPSGCLFFSRPERGYASLDHVLDRIAREAGYVPDRSRYRLRQAEVAGDVVTFHYQGVHQPGDRAWVARFAAKTSEQRPDELGSLEELMRAIGAGKDGFQVVAREERGVSGLKVQFASYRYHSPYRAEGKPVTAGGVAAVTRLERGPAPLIFQINVANIEGDRTDLGFRELEPFIAAIQG